MAYCTVEDIRDEGVTEDELTDERAGALIVGWSAWFERMTGNFFEEQELTLDFDGDGSRVLWLPVPIITCTALYINDDFTNARAATEYTVYNARGPVVDDRRNPRIKLKAAASANFFSSSAGVFSIGDRNQRVVGTFGYTEADGSVPSPVKRAIIILIIATKELINDDSIDQLLVGKITEEVTDRHRIKYADLYDRIQKWAPTGITEVDAALAAYRCPTRVEVPRNMGLFV